MNVVGKRVCAAEDCTRLAWHPEIAYCGFCEKLAAGLTDVPTGSAPSRLNRGKRLRDGR